MVKKGGFYQPGYFSEKVLKSTNQAAGTTITLPPNRQGPGRFRKWHLNARGGSRDAGQRTSKQTEYYKTILYLGSRGSIKTSPNKPPVSGQAPNHKLQLNI